MLRRYLPALLLATCGCLGPRSEFERNRTGPLSSRYRDAAQRIITETLKTNRAYDKLEELCDGIGHRLSGSPQLEAATAWAEKTLRAEAHENVRSEPVMVPHWVRGDESCEMIEPRRIPLQMLGLGNSVATPPEGITAQVEVVRDENELAALGDKAAGKIILFNNAMHRYDPVKGTGYGDAVRFRGAGPRLAAEKGAVACLVRSVTATSLRSPHTGATGYRDAPRKIPAAAVSIEDAEMIARMRARGQKVVVTLKMEAKTLDDAPSANVVAELRGSTWPEEIVVVGGHSDSWDVGQGAHDDGAGCVMSMEVIRILRSLNMRPRRTIRVVLFTNEENGLRGGIQYAKDHEAELDKHVAAIESDFGGFAPAEFGVSLRDEKRTARAFAQLGDVVKLLKPLGAVKADDEGGGADISPMGRRGVPTLGFGTEGSRYFDYHHTHADTLDKVNRDELSRSTAALTVVAYVLADMPERLGD